MVSWICPYGSGSLLQLYVQPGTRSNGIVGEHDGRLKIRISAPPRDGEANREVISFFAGLLKVPKKEIEILRGESGRSKDVFVNLPPEKIMVLLSSLF